MALANTAGKSTAPPPGKPPAVCPAPTPALRQLFTNAYSLADTTTLTKLHHAVAEAVRLRLDQLFKADCAAALSSKQLTEQLVEIADDGALRERFHVSIAAGHYLLSYYAADTAGLVLYGYKQGQVVTRIVVTQDGPKMEQRLLTLAARVFQPPGAPEPLLAISSTHPWVASCWRSLRFRVLEPSGKPLSPRTLLDHKTSGRWCEDHGIEVRGALVEFSYPDWYSIFKPSMVRGRTLSLEYQAGKLARRFGAPGQLHELVEDWLTLDWSLAREASAARELSALKPRHEQLSKAARAAQDPKARVDFTFELFPGGSEYERRLVVYCAQSQDARRPCATWPKPVDFKLERAASGPNAGRWLVQEATSR